MDGLQFTRRNSIFTMTCAVKLNIHASAEIIWSLLTDAPGFSRWNSTITRIDGHIREGERLRLHVPGTSKDFIAVGFGEVMNPTREEGAHMHPVAWTLASLDAATEAKIRALVKRAVA
ncbi:MAG: hypothetical protein ACRENN_04890 [Candidatus Eiseniibacteriota bacterium]